jgi:HD-like signal output (HDOD) protein
MWNAVLTFISTLLRGDRGNSAAAHREPHARRPAVRASRAEPTAPSTSAAPTNDVGAPLPSGAPADVPRPGEHTPALRRDYEEHSRAEASLPERERRLLENIAKRIEAGDFELPQLPSTSLAVIDMTSRSATEMSDIVQTIESDPVLSSELLKTANSVLYAGAEPVDTIAQSVMRIGMRNLRTLMFSISMRSAVLRDKRLSTYAEEVWRQSFSMASIARAIAKPLGVEPDRAFLQGLLADIGKVSLLAMLRRELQKNTEVSQTLVGRVFYLYHETAGARLAKVWRLPEEIQSVIGCHHHFEKNEHNPQEAALVCLANRLDLLLVRGDENEYRNAIHAPEMDYLEINVDQRRVVLEAARGAFARETPVA